MLVNEFFRYTFISQIDTSNYEFYNIIERWLLTSANDYRESDADRLIDNRKLQNDYFATAKMFSEMEEKKIDVSWATKFIDAAVNWLNSTNPITDVNIEIIHPVMKLTANTGEIFIYTFPPDLLTKLLIRGNEYQLACVCLRYACILQRGQHWATLVDYYKLILSLDPNAIEGFASPLNSRIILCSDTAKFCSVFPDVDAPFGSIGSVFEQDFTGKTVTLFAPYTVFILDSILKILLDHKDKSGRFILGLPNWRDTELIKYLEKNNVYKKVVRAWTYPFTDTRYNHMIVAPFAGLCYVHDINMPRFNGRPVDAYYARCETLSSKILTFQQQVRKTKGLDFRKLPLDPEKSRMLASYLMHNKKVEKVVNLFDPNLQQFCHFLLSQVLQSRKYTQSELVTIIQSKMRTYIN